MAPDAPLTLRHERFCELYVRTGVASAAAEGAGFSPRRAKQTGHELLQRPEILARIEQLRGEVAEVAKLEAADLVQYFWTIATADPRELIEYRRTCCRHCWGLHHGYQRTTQEIYRAVRAYAEAKVAKRRDLAPVFQFAEDDGGPGWDPDREPNDDCPECFGHGVERELVNDTRLLSPAARRLYAGVKRTKDGLQVQMQDQQAAAVNAGKIIGAFKEVVEHHDATLEDLIRAAAADEGTAQEEPRAGDA